MHDKQPPTYPGRQSDLDRLLTARREERDRHLAEIGRLPPVFKVAFPAPHPMDRPSRR